MSRDPVTVEAGADIRSAMETMRTAQVRRLPVTEGGKLAGMLSIDDIARSGKWGHGVRAGAVRHHGQRLPAVR